MRQGGMLLAEQSFDPIPPRPKAASAPRSPVPHRRTDTFCPFRRAAAGHWQHLDFRWNAALFPRLACGWQTKVPLCKKERTRTSDRSVSCALPPRQESQGHIAAVSAMLSPQFFRCHTSGACARMPLRRPALCCCLASFTAASTAPSARSSKSAATSSPLQLRSSETKHSPIAHLHSRCLRKADSTHRGCRMRARTLSTHAPSMHAPPMRRPLTHSHHHTTC